MCLGRSNRVRAIIAFPILYKIGFLEVMERDFAKMITEEPLRFRVLRIRLADMLYLKVRLTIIIWKTLDRSFPGHVTILCTNAVDYSIRPPRPSTIEGGPLIEYYEEHELLKNEHLQMIPGGDGKVFNPRLKFGLLMLDQSYVIAERFEIVDPPKA